MGVFVWFQRVVPTRRADDLRLYLDGTFTSSVDEYRYHEAWVHPAMASVRRPERILLLGAGDGLALREILRWPSVRSVTLVELDPLILDIARRHPRLLALNQGSLTHPRVTVLTGDAFTYTRRLDDSFDVVIADFPDPTRQLLLVFTALILSIFEEASCSWRCHCDAGQHTIFFQRARIH